MVRTNFCQTIKTEIVDSLTIDLIKERVVFENFIHSPHDATASEKTDAIVVFKDARKGFK
jgi:hypothetical protein